LLASTAQAPCPCVGSGLPNHGEGRTFTRAGAVRRARQGPEVKLSDARATVPSWSCQPRAPPGRAGALRGGAPRAELELSERAPRAPSWAQRWPPPWSATGPGRRRQPWHRAAIRAAVLKGAALPIPPPFRKAPRCPSWARRWSLPWSAAGPSWSDDDGAALPIPPPFRNGAALPFAPPPERRRAARTGRGGFGAGLHLAGCSTSPRRSAPPT
jgi:hypothetical protein